MDGKVVTIVSCDSGDWSGMYVDGRLKYEGHQIYEHDFIHLIQTYKVFERVDSLTVSDERMEELGASFPRKLEDI